MDRGSLGGGLRRRRSGPNALLGLERELRVGEARGVPPALLRRDPREDAVEMGVIDDDPGDEFRLIAGMQPVGEHAAVAANRDRALGILADERGRATQAAIR